MSNAEEWIIREHELKWNDRIERLQWLRANTPVTKHGFVFSGGEVTARLWEESKYCFVEGQFLATTILCLSFVEHHLSGLMYGAGMDDAENYTAYNTIEEAKESDLITSEEASLLHRVRQTRNPIAHFQKPADDDTLMRRAMSTDTTTDEIVEADARNALKAMFRVSARSGIGVDPQNHPNQTTLHDFAERQTE